MLTRTRRRALVVLVPLAAVPLLVAATHGSRHLTTLLCNSTITTSTTLAADLGPCAGTGLVIGADHVTLNLNGHRLSGSGGSIGVSSDHVGVVVENGTVTNFDTDVSLSGDSSRVTNLRVSGAAIGVSVIGKHDLISGNRVFANSSNGIVGSGAGSQYTNNVLQSNGSDGLDAANAATVTGNKALNNGGDGIFFSNSAGGPMTITNNIGNGNHVAGIHESGGGDPTVVTVSGNKGYFNTQLGVAAVPGVTDGGNNKADENGTAAQCANVVCS
jgi:hypothetical protein